MRHEATADILKGSGCKLRPDMLDTNYEAGLVEGIW